MSKNILICTETLGIGGIETVVYNQAIALKKKGCNVYVLAEDGEYKNKIEENGIECIYYNFKTRDTFEVESVNNLISIIKEKKITEIQVHQIGCMPLMLMVCIKTKIPYLVYMHDALPKTYDWFIESFNIYNFVIKTFLQNAQKIICITESVKEYNKKRFEIDESKFLVIKNSINFDEYKCTKKMQTEKLTKFLIVSRMQTEKITSIKNAIEVFCMYTDKTSLNTKLTVIGDGSEKQEIIDYINKKNEKYNIEYKGGTNEVNKYVNENEVVFGLGRCILEAIAMKRIAVISGYEKMKGIVKNNLEQALNENLSGRNLQDLEIEKQVEEIINLTKNEIEKTTDENYQLIKSELDINNNIYTIPEETNTLEVDYFYVFQEINNFVTKINSLKEENEKIWKEREWFKNQEETKIETKNKEIQELNKIIEQYKKEESKYKIQIEEVKKITDGRLYKILRKIKNTKK